MMLFSSGYLFVAAFSVAIFLMKLPDPPTITNRPCSYHYQERRQPGNFKVFAITLPLWKTPEYCNRRLRMLGPSLQLPLPLNVYRCYTTLLCQLGLGVAFTNLYSFFFIEIPDSPICDHCKCVATIKNLLYRCTHFDVQRTSASSEHTQPPRWSILYKGSKFLG